MLIKAREQPLESPRQRPDLIAAARFRHLEPDPAVVTHRRIRGGAQPPDAHADESREAEGEHHRERGREQGEVKEMREGAVAEVEQLIPRLLQHHRAAGSVVHCDGRRGKQQKILGARAGAQPLGRRPSAEGRGDAVGGDPIGERCLPWPRGGIDGHEASIPGAARGFLEVGGP